MSAVFVAGTLSTPMVKPRALVTEIEYVTVVQYVTAGFVAPAAPTPAEFVEGK